MKNDRLIDLGLTGYEELFMSTEERLNAKKPRVEAIPLAALTPFRNHPFKVKEDEEMAQLMRSIADAGVLSPALARPLPDGGYELISGHRRLAACKALGMDTMPVIIRDLTDGKSEIVCADRAKTKSSLRSLPLVSNIREKLLALREQQKENRRVCGNCYSKKYDGYVFVDAMGNIFNPRSVTANFSKLLEQNGLRHIRFHDLRHSCASLLLANDVPLKQIQEWLGHSDIGTTANIYSHLDYKSKITSANVMDNILTLPDTRQTGWHT